MFIYFFLDLLYRHRGCRRRRSRRRRRLKGHFIAIEYRTPELSIQRSAKKWSLGCVNFFDFSARLFLSKRGPRFSPSLYSLHLIHDNDSASPFSPRIEIMFSNAA